LISPNIRGDYRIFALAFYCAHPLFTCISDMKEIFGYLRDHIAADFKWGYYLFMAVFLGLATYFNFYYFPEVILPTLGTGYQDITFEIYLYAKGQNDTAKLIASYFMLYGVPYFVALGAHLVFHKERAFVRQWAFWLKAIAALLILSTDASVRLFRIIDIRQLLEQWFGQITPDDAYWVKKLLANVSSSLNIGIPLMLIWLLYDRRHAIRSWYGLTLRNFHWKPYALMMGIMAVIVGAASFSPHFTGYYPTLKPRSIDQLSLVAPSTAIIAYETLYGLDFIWTEMAFRGFMIVGLAGLMGRAAIMPMVAVYCVRHYAKPMGEAVSSIFGGYILGILAFRTENIMGGVCIHMGVALLMDLTAWAQLSFP